MDKSLGGGDVFTLTFFLTVGIGLCQLRWTVFDRVKFNVVSLGGAKLWNANAHQSKMWVDLNSSKVVFIFIFRSKIMDWY